jgi:hypothetical protein
LITLLRLFVVFADAPEELKVDFHASQEAARKWKVRSSMLNDRVMVQCPA